MRGCRELRRTTMMRHRIKGCFIWGSFIAVTVLGVAGAPRPASAGTLKCVSPWLAADDELLLRAGAVKVLPKSAQLTVTGACRNPGSALGFIETRKSITS